MTDLVERLQNRSPYLHGSSAEHTMAEAADEIERLAMLYANAKHWEAQWLAEIERQQAEIEHLRMAIAYVRQRSQHACEILNEFDNTRAALDPKP